MIYPGYPDNRLIVNDVDLTVRFGLVLLDGYVRNPPEPNVYMVTIPSLDLGGNSRINLTKALTGETSYSNRLDEFTFALLYPKDFEKTKTEIMNFLHG